MYVCIYRGLDFFLWFYRFMEYEFIRELRIKKKGQGSRKVKNLQEQLCDQSLKIEDGKFSGNYNINVFKEKVSLYGR